MVTFNNRAEEDLRSRIVPFKEEEIEARKGHGLAGRTHSCLEELSLCAVIHQGWRSHLEFNKAVFLLFAAT